MKPNEVVRAFDGFLAERGFHFEAIIIGGTALNLLGVIDRVTKDCDVLAPEIPVEIAEAARAFARQQREAGHLLQEQWLNNGPASLVPALPSGWQERLNTAFVGQALVLRVLGRTDLLRSKLFALCDRALDLPDCIALAPSASELAEILPWLEEQDTNPGWPQHVRETLDDLKRRLAHAP